MRPCISICVATIAALGIGSFATAQTPTRTKALPRIRVSPVTATPRAAPASGPCTARSGGSPRPTLRTAAAQVPLLLPYVAYPTYPVPYGYSYAPIEPYAAPVSPGKTHDDFRLPYVSTLEEKERAEKLMDRGDASFARRQYASAAARYREAAQVAPDVADARLRLSLALVAARRYPAAARAFFEALDVRKEASEPLRLKGLYASGQLARTTAALEQRVAREPMDAELALALGIQLYFTGQPSQARRYFNRAAQLGIDQDDRLTDFLENEELAQAP